MQYQDNKRGGRGRGRGSSWGMSSSSFTHQGEQRNQNQSFMYPKDRIQYPNDSTQLRTLPYQYQVSAPPQERHHVSNTVQNPKQSHENWNRMGQQDIVRLSKTLAFLLRHGAEKLGFHFMPGGFLYVDELLKYHKPLWGFTLPQIQELVRTNVRQQFALQIDAAGRWMIRDNQGHDIVQLSKTLAFLLRHGAEKSGFHFMPGGFLYVDELLKYHKPLRGFTLVQIQELVKTNDKQRFALQEDADGRLMIRANQGHSTAVEGLDLTPISDDSEVEMVVHGTYYQAWEQIQRTGLSRMNRNHIHFAAGMPGGNGVISGMRKSCEVVIELDLKKALEAGIPFFRSANNVILSPGNEKGFIPSTFFKRVFDRYSGQPLPMDLLSSESSFGQDTSSPSDHVTGERRTQDLVKRKSRDQSKDQVNPKRTKKDMPELGSHDPRSEKDRKTPNFDKSQGKETTEYCRPQKESGKETTKQMGQKMKKETQGHPDQISLQLRYSQWYENEDISEVDKRAGTMSKSQNKKEKQ